MLWGVFGQRLLAFVAAIVLTVLDVSVCRAAEPSAVPPELLKFLASEAEQRTLLLSNWRQWKVSVDSCATQRLLRANVIVQVVPKFNSDGLPVSGVWRVISQVEGCGQTRVFSLLYSFTANGNLEHRSLLPGMTIADPMLQRDAVMYAAMGMRKRVPVGCREILILDTAFVAFGEVSPSARKDREARSWSEMWLVKACDAKGLVTLYFVPDATGTSIIANPDETKSLSPE